MVYTPQMLVHYLARRPDWSEAIIALVNAEADLEEDGKHFPYRESGGTEEDERIAERITEIAQHMSRKSQLES